MKQLNRLRRFLNMLIIAIAVILFALIVLFYSFPEWVDEQVKGGMLTMDSPLARQRFEAQVARASKEDASTASLRAVALAHLYGQGTAQSAAAAQPWLERAAQGGDALCQGLLGELLSESDSGVTNDPVAAYAWLTLAIEKEPSFSQKRVALARTLSPDQIARGERQVTRWLDDHPQWNAK